MNEIKDGEPNPTTVEPKSEREIVVTRTFDAPARIVFQAWTTPALFKRWWIPKSMPLALLSYDADIRTGGSYRLVFDVDGTKTMAFFGKYIEVTPHSRIVWTNDESGEDGAVSTVTVSVLLAASDCVTAMSISVVIRPGIGKLDLNARRGT